MKFAALILTALSVACGCPSNETGVDTRALWTVERDAACAAVEGCDADFVADVPVFEADLEYVREMCDGGRACLCIGVGCPGVILLADADVQIDGCPASQESCWYTQHDNIMHEYVHAAFRSVGRATGDHPTDFVLAEQRARANFDQ